MKFFKPLTALTLLAAMAAPAIAQDAFKAADFVYGPRDAVEGEIEIWNGAKQKLIAGEDLVGVTIESADPRTYCAAANAGYGFTWVEMQHQSLSWESVSRMYATCPNATASHGARLPYVDEHHVQQALDAGATVLVFPTIDTEEEAKMAVHWSKFPPFGAHSQGGGQRWSMYANVPGGYRATANENTVVILMIETLEGVENVDKIAAVPGVDALFIASGDLSNFSGYRQGEPQYEELVDRIAKAANDNGVRLCGPLGWRASREGYTCFQAGSEASLIRRGAEAEAQATARP